MATNNFRPINGTLIRSIPAGTYNTYALALADLESYYDNLTTSEKIRSIILRDTVVFNIQNITDKNYCMPPYCYTDNPMLGAQTMDLKNHKYTQTVVNNGGVVNKSDVSPAEQGLKLELWVL